MCYTAPKPLNSSNSHLIIKKSSPQLPQIIHDTDEKSFIFIDAYDHSYTHNTYESSHRSHHELHQEFDHNRHYNMVHQHTLPPPPPPRHHYEPYLPPQYNFPPENNILRRYQEERERDRHFWGMKHADTGWASYGGPYGDFGTSLRRNYDNYNTRFHHTNELYDRADNRYSHEGERYDTRQYGAQTFSHGHSSASHNWGSNESFKNVGGYHYNAPHKIGSYVPAPPLNNEIGGVEHRGPKNGRAFFTFSMLKVNSCCFVESKHRDK